MFWKLSSCQLHQLEIFFSPSVGYLFVPLNVSFAVQKLVSLIRSYLFIFAFISVALRDLRRFMSGNVLPILSSRRFMVCPLLHLGL